MSYIRIPSDRVPVLLTADVVVCGGGVAGISSAIAAARHGADVVLLEKMPTVGGMATNGLVNIWHTSDRTCQVIFGLVQEVIERGGDWVQRYDDFPDRHDTHWFEPEGMRLVFEALLREAGVRVVCNLMPVETVVEAGRIQAIFVDTKQGRRAVKGKVFIDATGDGDVAANAGVPFRFGRDSDGCVQGSTLMFSLHGIDTDRARMNDPEMVSRLVAEMEAEANDGLFPPFNNEVLRINLSGHANNHYPFNVAPVAGNTIDEAELTEMTMRVRSFLPRYLERWRRCIPGYENAEIEQTAACLGVRESRRIQGRVVLDRDMVLGTRKHGDAIGHGVWMIDIHDPKGSGYTTWSDGGEDHLTPKGKSYHIPLGMCLNEQFENLAVSGRCASSTHEGHASVRLQTHCMVMGQGVGTAATMSLNHHDSFHSVDVPELQRLLRADGVFLEDVPSS
ncbi:FAD-dependent oxidoreductase [Coraliomargarita sp. SDUM461004]|uniref:FAD-dependent oxidoreductase n=1 Tax=Thalassobacterium sedimentorum TaxID=3041258 RepID=A0ABU1AQM6_9BACT|nr:FAD-dependent oxidoreductase [Coraliomargarita sp. SDUM461004]MDQ8196180.1 FAD-dependent oxidoreductase [Coraliomargarita sp. SDUM461004]